MTENQPAAATAAETRTPASVEDDVHTLWRRVVVRCTFLKSVGLASAAALPGSALFASKATARAGAITYGLVAGLLAYVL